MNACEDCGTLISCLLRKCPKCCAHAKLAHEAERERVKHGQERWKATCQSCGERFTVTTLKEA